MVVLYFTLEMIVYIPVACQIILSFKHQMDFAVDSI